MYSGKETGVLVFGQRCGPSIGVLITHQARAAPCDRGSALRSRQRLAIEAAPCDRGSALRSRQRLAIELATWRERQRMRAANLDLMIVAEEVDRAVLAPARQVAGHVHASTSCMADGSGTKRSTIRTELMPTTKPRTQGIDYSIAISGKVKLAPDKCLPVVNT
jgi:hypothetical protein